MFPGPGAEIYRNEAGEVLGWDYPSEPEYDPNDYLPEEEMDDMDDNQEQTWPDLDKECERHIKAAFHALSLAPGYRQTYQRVQEKLAEAVRILRGDE